MHKKQGAVGTLTLRKKPPNQYTDHSPHTDLKVSFFLILTGLYSEQPLLL